MEEHRQVKQGRREEGGGGREGEELTGALLGKRRDGRRIGVNDKGEGMGNRWEGKGR